jgi:hypothetical protein
MSVSYIDYNAFSCLQSFTCSCNAIKLIFLVCASNRQAKASSMESQSEELSRLRAEKACMKQLLSSKDAQLAQSCVVIASKDEVIACKDELLLSRSAELQRCQQLMQWKPLSAERAAAVTDSSNSSKRQCLRDSCAAELPLDRDVLDYVFSFVGGGDHLYTGGVSKRWRGIYIQYRARTVQQRLIASL